MEMENGGGVLKWSALCWDLNMSLPQINLPPSRTITNKDGPYLTPRYKILRKMGAGAFGQVFECWDCQNQETVAVKVSRSLPKYRNVAKREMDVLLQIAAADKSGEHFVRVRDYFNYHDHICIVFEKLEPSLHDLFRKNDNRSLSLDLVRDIVIDFGCATFEYQNRGHLITTRPYRAPEVILGNEWSYPCDMWSVGCILIELCTGQVPFRTSRDLDSEHLVMMEAVLGPLPHHTHTVLPKAVKSKSSQQYISEERQMDICTVEDLVMRHVGDSAAANDLVDLLRRLLCYFPAERLQARDALAHPFFSRC